ncbi:FACT complex subunit SPT16-like [Salvia miltiorrhiza]|uniref:FACT complex subunit SPT16-like n=1 Tax=Salvia miltiorrhiza TaxID=226208 RepID=UPI0025AD72A3|nr:FACT complex subunit SPT16-like [Salvia miltiorrhiza]XP_057792001.1 FACT complex subunit SPT16-like [Salvia miltiorrhiza]XP_057792002.1 FACT complex subunit SPT16-like [Salvia miltiorrhiza]
MPEERNGLTANANMSAGNKYTIDLPTFSRRLQDLYKHWQQHKDELWGSADVLVVATPPPSEDLRYLKSSALNIWLLGYEFPDTIMVFGEKNIHFICSGKKASLLEVVKASAKETVKAEVVVWVKAKNENGSTQIDKVLRAIRSQPKSDDHDTPVVGNIAREDPEGKLLELWSDKLKASGLTLNDISNGLSDLFAAKDKNEITCIKKAAYLTAYVMKNFVLPEVLKVIDEEKKVTHSELMEQTEKAISDPLKIGVKLKAENVDICYPPIFQSGGNFDLRPSATSTDDSLYYDSPSVIICAVGCRYNSYCSNVARTYLIDTDTVQTKAYEVLLRAHEAAIHALKPGNKVSAVYDAALTVVNRDAPELVPHLTKSAGTGIGLEFRESGLTLNGKNERLLKEGMAFNVSLGFKDLQSKSSNPKSQNFSLLLADTVIVTDGVCYVATLVSPKVLKDVAYCFNEDGEEEEPRRVNMEPNARAALYSKATLRSDNGEISKEELRKQHQAELARQKIEETARRLVGVGSANGDGRATVKSASDLVAYKSINELPPPREMMIQVDQKHEAILIPIYGCMVPFHVATVKTVSSQQDTNRNCYVRIIFNVPGTPFTPHDANSLKNQGVIYLKEVSFRSKDPRHISEVVQQIKTLRRGVMARESERAERATLVTQEKLELAGNKFKPIRLHDLWIRPNFGGRARKLCGTLEAHSNGFRYSTSRKDERVDIMYGNIKHAFFQPAEKEMITLLHFHLHNHIMVGNKKTKDVQFYVEVMEMVQNISSGKRSAYDPDEIEEEQRERDRKNKINMEFQQYVNRVNDLWGQPQLRLDLEFDQPLRELGFHGVPYKASAFIVPTSSCLVELIETPFLVISLSEIEIVNLERVGLAQKNFDMAIVFKDFKRDVMRIDSIPSSSLDGIKEWLDTTDTKYYESRLNLNWRPILKTIMDDPQQFIEEGGWEFLNLEGTDSDSDNSAESDKGYEPSDAEPESESEDDASESESLVESDDDEEESEVESEEDKGKTWEELEREASNADREKGNESDSEDERRRRKTKTFGKARAGPSSAASKRSKFR